MPNEFDPKPGITKRLSSEMDEMHRQSIQHLKQLITSLEAQLETASTAEERKGIKKQLDGYRESLRETQKVFPLFPDAR